MKKTSVNLEQDIYNKVLELAERKGLKPSTLLRELIKDGLSYHSLMESGQAKHKTGKNSLMVAERAAIQASIESLLLLRKIINKPDIIEEVKKQAYDIIEQRWNYEMK